MLERVIETRRRDIGGFEVARALPSAVRRMVGPFIFLDHMGPATFAPGHGMDVRPHPHIGLSTVTYLFAGEVFHRDSLGVAQSIRPGEVNWMTAGSGITHSERSVGEVRRNGGPLHGIQSWVALRVEQEERAPSFVHHDAAQLPTFEEHGSTARLIAGDAYGLGSPVSTYSPLFYVHLELAAHARFALPDEHEERAAYIVEGSIEHEGRSYGAGRLLVFLQGEATISSTVPSRVILLGGAPIGERFIWWNLVSSRRDRIRQGKEDWIAGKFELPPGDDREFIPAPDSPPLP
ncbi:MAG: pirin family protein [Alphaproteobacteria bacterium]